MNNEGNEEGKSIQGSAASCHKVFATHRFDREDLAGEPDRGFGPQSMQVDEAAAFRAPIMPQSPAIDEPEIKYAQLRETFIRANSFEWDANSYPARAAARNPNRFLTPSCFWAMTNAQYFPYAAYFLAQDPEANESLLEDVREAARDIEDG